MAAEGNERRGLQSCERHGEGEWGKTSVYLLMQEVRVSKEAVRGWVLKKQERFHLRTMCS